MTNTLAQVTSLFSEDFSTFKVVLKEIIKSYDNSLREDLFNFVFCNAKFLRPRFVFLFSKILNINDDNIIKIAVASELLHNASLIHDDIIDNSYLRRRLPTFNKKFNSKTAVLMGDLLLAGALEVLTDTTRNILKIFSDKIFKTIQGEIKQNENYKKITSVDTYLNKTFSKTGNLFFAGLESLFTLKNIDEKLKDRLKFYLKNYCLAFQIQNDIDDVDFDFENGNYTLPFIYYFCDNEVFDKNNMEKYILKSKTEVLNHKTKAKEAIGNINDKYKKALFKLVDII